MERWQLERWNRDDIFAGHGQRLTTRGEHAHAARTFDDLIDELSRSSEKVLAVVQYKQQLLVLQVSKQQRQRVRGCLVSQVQAGRNGVADQGAIPNLGKLDEPGAVPETTTELRCGANCQPGLTHTAWADKAQQAGRGELRSELR